jgi:hypothetical protein
MLANQDGLQEATSLYSRGQTSRCDGKHIDIEHAEP